MSSRYTEHVESAAGTDSANSREIRGKARVNICLVCPCLQVTAYFVFAYVSGEIARYNLQYSCVHIASWTVELAQTNQVSHRFVDKALDMLTKCFNILNCRFMNHRTLNIPINNSRI